MRKATTTQASPELDMFGVWPLFSSMGVSTRPRPLPTVRCSDHTGEEGSWREGGAWRGEMAAESEQAKVLETARPQLNRVINGEPEVLGRMLNNATY